MKQKFSVSFKNSLNTSFYNLSDEMLVTLCQRGNRKAIEEIISRYQLWTFNIVIRVKPDLQNATRLTEEIFTKMMTRLATFKKREKFFLWFNQIVVNHLKKNNEINIKKNTIKHIPCTATLYIPFLLSQTREQIKIKCSLSLLSHLCNECRLIVIFKDILGLNEIEMTEILNIHYQNFFQKEYYHFWYKDLELRMCHT